MKKINWHTQHVCIMLHSFRLLILGNLAQQTTAHLNKHFRMLKHAYLNIKIMLSLKPKGQFFMISLTWNRCLQRLIPQLEIKPGFQKLFNLMKIYTFNWYLCKLCFSKTWPSYYMLPNIFFYSQNFFVMHILSFERFPGGINS